MHIEELARKHDCTPPQLALAWLLHQGDDIIPIPGTTKVKNLDNNLGSLALKLTQEDVSIRKGLSRYLRELRRSSNWLCSTHLQSRIFSWIGWEFCYEIDA